MDYEIFLPDDNVTESNFYLQKFCINFGDSKRIKKKGMRKGCPKAEQYVYILQTHMPSSVSMNKS